MQTPEFEACREAFGALVYALSMTFPDQIRGDFSHHLRTLLEQRVASSSGETLLGSLLQAVQEVEDLVRKHRGSH